MVRCTSDESQKCDPFDFETPEDLVAVDAQCSDREGAIACLSGLVHYPDRSVSIPSAMALDLQ